MIKYIRHAVSIIFFFSFPCYCNGQIELSAGIGLSYPEVLTSNHTIINAGEISSGLRVGIAYKPEETQFYPVLNCSYGNIWLPLQQFGKNISDLKFNYVNVMLNEDCTLSFKQSRLCIYGGIGVSHLKEKGIPVSDRNVKTMQTSIDSTADVSKIFPAMNIGIEYNYGESTGKALYLALGINFQYILLLNGHNTYYLKVTEPGNNIYHYQSSLTGNLISPGLYIAIHYKYKNHKKKSGRYL